MVWIPPDLSEACAVHTTITTCQASTFIFLQLVAQLFGNSKDEKSPQSSLTGFGYSYGGGFSDDFSYFSGNEEKEKPEEYDFIVVGAGSAGCVVANRLSEIPEWKCDFGFWLANMSFYFVSSAIGFRDEADVWTNTPTYRGIILYSVVTPILCCFGLITNTLSLIVLKRKELMGSVFTYLAVLACVDIGMSLVLMLEGISDGLMWKYGWGPYESLISLPLGGCLNTLGVLAIVSLTIDRAVYLWNPVRCAKPLFCTSWMARRLMVASFLIAVVFNLPYCFIFEKRGDGLITTPIFDSKFYKAFNWFTFIVFAVVPTFVLLLGNGILIKSLRMAKKVHKKCCNRKGRDHTNLTITLIMIIVFFLITNIPENLVSRTAAINLLFEGDHQKADTETLETLRQICIILGAIDVNTNFVFYYTFCPAFCKALKAVFKRKRNHLQVNVFVLNSIGVKPNHKQMQRALALSKGCLNLDKIPEKCNFTTPNAFEMNREEYIPPFSTILEESSSLSTTCVNK